MSETDEYPAKAPRFPYVAALLCAACIGAAAWTWMRYSWAWHFTPAGLGGLKANYDGHLWTFGSAEHGSWPVGSFVRLRVQRRGAVLAGYPLLVQTSECEVDALEIMSDLDSWRMLALADDTSLNNGRWLYGRLVPYDPPPLGPSSPDWDAPPGTAVIDTRCSRFTGASIAGLVVGAMGVFVFTAALRHWLGQRRRNGIVT